LSFPNYSSFVVVGAPQNILLLFPSVVGSAVCWTIGDSKHKTGFSLQRLVHLVGKTTSQVTVWQIVTFWLVTHALSSLVLFLAPMYATFLVSDLHNITLPSFGHSLHSINSANVDTIATSSSFALI
jgi:hypothetical protein